MRLRLVRQSRPDPIIPAFGVVTTVTTNYVLQQHDGLRWRTLPSIDFDTLSKGEQQEIYDSYNHPGEEIPHLSKRCPATRLDDFRCVRIEGHEGKHSASLGDNPMMEWD